MGVLSPQSRRAEPLYAPTRRSATADGDWSGARLPPPPPHALTPALRSARTPATPPPGTAAPREEAPAEEGEEDRSLPAGSHFPAPPLAADTLRGVTTPCAAGDGGRRRRPWGASQSDARAAAAAAAAQTAPKARRPRRLER